MARDWTIIRDLMANFATLAGTIKTTVAGRPHKVIAMTTDGTNIYILIELN